MRRGAWVLDERDRTKVLAAGVAALLAAAVVVVGASRPNQPADAAGRIDEIFAAYSAAGSPGCAVSVTHKGQLAFAKGYGRADLEHDTPITPDTAFYAASVSKQFTAAAIALLARRGTISPDDDVRKYVPEVPDFGTRVTISHLLHHTSGMRDYFGVLQLGGWPPDGPVTHRDFLDLVSRQRALNFEPGSEHLYSNTGYVLLSVVVQRASGRSLREYAEAEIFKPLGMSRSVFRDDHAMLVRNRARAYAPAGPSAYRTSEPGFDVVGDGGLYTTVEDLAKWDPSRLDAALSEPGLTAMISTPGRLTNGESTGYAFGLSISQWRGVAIWGHGGAYGGYRASALRLPDGRLGVSVLCNVANANPARLTQRVAEIYLSGELQPEPPAAPASGGPPAMARPNSGPAAARDWTPGAPAEFAGTFYSEEANARWTVLVRDGRLMVRRGTLAEAPLTPVEQDTFTQGPGGTVRFIRNAAGEITGLSVTAGRIRNVGFTKQ